MAALPAGTVTFLFTEIEDSTRLLSEVGQDDYLRCLADHEFLMRTAISQQRGDVVKPDGGVVFAVFQTAVDSINAVIEAQRLLQGHRWPGDADVRIKMGLHTGIGTPLGDDYTGLDVHRAARIASAAYGGQVVVSGSTAESVRLTLPVSTSLRDLGTHSLKDFASEQLYQLVIEGLPREFPPLATYEDHPSNLPVALSSFVGRETEIAEIEELLRSGRLVTVAGVAGAGKTRVAIEVGQRHPGDFPDGVWFVDLSTVRDGDLVALKAAGAIGVRERPGVDIADTLHHHLARKRALLVLDNCEHLIDAVGAFVTGLLGAAPECKVLATSRQVLRIRGEVAYRLSSMSLPDAAGAPENSDAVRLLAERAAAVHPGFEITTENAADIVEICTQLDGMPLAIELAAAQLGTASPRQVASHLGRSFQGATSAAVGSAPRQRTLASAIDWSYQLLDNTEQAVFRRLSVFRGGFTLDAAQAVCADEGLGPFDVLNAVSALVDKSLVTADVGAEVSRYRLLEMLRRFAAERLDEAPAAVPVQLRHAEYFTSFAEDAEPDIRGANEMAVRASIERELDNIERAVAWAAEHGHAELATRTAGAIWRFWWATFRFSAGVRTLAAVLGAVGEVEDVDRAKVLVGLGTLRSYTEDPVPARALLESAIDLYREADACGVADDILCRGYPAALVSLGTNVWQSEQDHARAAALWREALAIARRTGDIAAESSALGNLAEAAALAGDVEEARDGYAASIEASRRLESPHRTAEAMFLSAVFELSIDEPEHVVTLLDDAVVVAKRGDLPFWAEFSQVMRAVARHDLDADGARDQFIEHARHLLADDEFLATYYYQLPLVLWRADIESRRDASVSARLLGFIDAIEAQHSPMEQVFEGSRRSRLVAALAAELGDAEYRSQLAAGRMLSPTAGLELATAT